MTIVLPSVLTVAFAPAPLVTTGAPAPSATGMLSTPELGASSEALNVSGTSVVYQPLAGTGGAPIVVAGLTVSATNAWSRLLKVSATYSVPPLNTAPIG